MTFDVEIDGRVQRIDAIRDANVWRVTLEGRTFVVDAARTSRWWSMIVGPDQGPAEGPAESPAEAGRYERPDVGAGFSRPVISHEVAIEDRGRGELVVHVDGTAVAVSIADPRAARMRRDREHGAARGGPTTVVAPMPGRIVKVLVKAGDQVTARQGLVVVEAMKMENELRAPRDGRVAEVRAVEGAPVDARAVLVVIE